MSGIVKYLSSLNLLESPWFVVAVVIVILLWSAIGVTAIAISSAKGPGLKKNTLFTTIKEGTAKAIMRGEEFDGIIASWRGHHINDPKAPWFNENRPEWEVLLNNDRDTPDANPLWNVDDWNNSRSFLEKWFGIYWVGLPFQKSLYVYKFEWTEEEQGEGGTYVPRPRTELTDFIYILDFSYYIILKDAETADNLPVNVRYLLTVRITNPRKALFDTDDWLKRITGLTNSTTRNHIGSLSFEELTSEKHKQDLQRKMESLITAILSLNVKLPASEDPIMHQIQSNGADVSAPSLYGVTIISADVQSIDPSGEIGQKAKAALTALYEAERAGKALEATARSEKEAAITRAQGERKAMVELSEGQMEAYNNISSSRDGLALRQLDVLESIGEKGHPIVVDGKTNLFLDVNKTRLVTDDE